MGLEKKAVWRGVWQGSVLAIIFSGVLAGLAVGGIELKRYILKKNLAPNAIYIEGYRTHNQTPVLSNENIDNDKERESIIKFYDKDGKRQKFEIIWDENHWPRIIYPTEK